MAVIFIDNTPYEVDTGKSLLENCLSLGFNIPYFCWHPAMHSVGACRQCAVKQFRDEKDTRGFIIMSCVTEVCEGMRISIDDPEAKEFRKGVIELLMTNHPHDCPVCDEGGECHLQDMTVMTGHSRRNFRFEKRTFHNQDLGPLVNHELNRCIQCYRCVRFYRDFAGGRDFNVFGVHNRLYFGRYESGTLESEFSGNLVEVCPTGVFTDKTLQKHYTRKWDLQTAPSVCVHCSVGCNTLAGERYGAVRRIRNRYNYEVNGYFLCDRGRYGYEFLNGDSRVRTCLIRENGSAKEVGPEHAELHVARELASGAPFIGIGSPRASVEANAALKLLVGEDNFFLGFTQRDYELTSLVYEILRAGAVPTASLHELGAADAAAVLGEDVSNTAPMAALMLRQSIRTKGYELSDKMGVPRWNDAAVRQAVRDDTGPLHVASPCATRLDDAASGTYRMLPDDIARVGFLAAALLEGETEAVESSDEPVRIAAERIAGDLADSARPVIVSGTGSGHAGVIRAAAALAHALKKSGKDAKLYFALPGCNALGLVMLGGGSITEAVQRVEEGAAETVLALETDLYRALPLESAQRLMSSTRVFAMDALRTRTMDEAATAMAVGTFADSDGTLVNNEGRAQRFFQVTAPVHGIRESRRCIAEIALCMIQDCPQEQLPTGEARRVLDALAQCSVMDDFLRLTVQAFPVFKGIEEAAPSSHYRVRGMRIARQSHRYSGRTAMNAQRDVHEHKPPRDVDSPLAFSMEGYQARPESALIPRFWAPHWNSDQSLNKFQDEVGGRLKGGNPGKRLIEPLPDAEIERAPFSPESGPVDSNEFLFAPMHEIFGSEELSAYSEPLASLIPAPYVILNSADAKERGWKEGVVLHAHISGRVVQVTLRTSPDIPRGAAGLSVGLPGLPSIELPAKGALEAATEAYR